MPGRMIERTWKHDPSPDTPAKYRRACKYRAFIPDELSQMQLSLEATVAGLTSEAEGAIRKLNETGGQALSPLARLLLSTESIASSKIEGLQLGVRQLARAEATMESGRDTSTTAREVLANIDAMTLAVEDAAILRRFGIEEITAIHRRLMEHSVNTRLAGRIRKNQNWIGGNDYNPCGADFVPPPPEHVSRLLKDLCASINGELLPPLVQAAVVHAQFETIHPFEDGNGRTGRALIHVVLRRRGLSPSYVPPISVALAAGKKRYIEGLEHFRADRVEDWIEYFATAAARAAKLATAYLQAVDALTLKWRKQLEQSHSAPRKGAAAWAVIDVLPAHPLITAPVATAATSRAKAAIYQAIDQLKEAGVLIPLSSSRRNQVWEAVGLLGLIERLEAVEASPTPIARGKHR